MASLALGPRLVCVKLRQKGRRYELSFTVAADDLPAYEAGRPWIVAGEYEIPLEDLRFHIVHKLPPSEGTARPSRANPAPR